MTDKRGWVYLLRNEQGVYKIGRTINPEDRLRTFRVQLPFPVYYVHLIPCEDCYLAETFFHEALAAYRLDGEWFRLTGEQVQAIKGIYYLSVYGINCHQKPWKINPKPKTPRFDDNPVIEDAMNELTELITAVTITFLRMKGITITSKFQSGIDAFLNSGEDAEDNTDDPSD